MGFLKAVSVTSSVWPTIYCNFFVPANCFQLPCPSAPKYSTTTKTIRKPTWIRLTQPFLCRLEKSRPKFKYCPRHFLDHQNIHPIIARGKFCTSFQTSLREMRRSISKTTSNIPFANYTCCNAGALAISWVAIFFSAEARNGCIDIHVLFHLSPCRIRECSRAVSPQLEREYSGKRHLTEQMFGIFSARPRFSSYCTSFLVNPGIGRFTCYHVSHFSP